MRSDDWHAGADRRPAPDGKPQLTFTGERFWVLRVRLYQPSWPADCVTRLLIWETTDGQFMTDYGRYFPEKVSTDEDDGA